MVKKSVQFSWMLFDWAAQPIYTLIVTFIFAPYWATTIVGDSVLGQTIIGNTNSIIGLCVALMAPFLGAYTDQSSHKKHWVFLCSILIVVGSSALWLAAPGLKPEYWPWIMAAYGLTIISGDLASVFTNAMMPQLSSAKSMGKLSGFGWGLGYLGGVIALFIHLLFFTETDSGLTLFGIPPIFGLDASTREGTRIVGPFCALWYAVFILPLFIYVKESTRTDVNTIDHRLALINLWQHVRSLTKQPSQRYFYLGSMLYRDALGGIFVFGGIYAAGVLQWSTPEIGLFGILAAVFASVGSFLGGILDSRYGSKRCIIGALIILLGVNLCVIGLSREQFFGVMLAQGSRIPDIIFYVNGALLGLASGPLQAASRTYLVNLSDPEKITQSFGLYAMTGKATAFLAPFLVGRATSWTGSQRAGIAPLIVLFILGFYFIMKVEDNPSWHNQKS